MENRLVSIIIPSYNRAETILGSVNSVLNQSYKNIEVIVVDDCSSDNTFEIVNAIKDNRVRCIKLEKNSGACIARNVGVENSKGEIIAFQDSDDIWHEDKLEKQLQYLLENNYEFISCAYTRIFERSRTVFGIVECPEHKVELWCKLLNNNWISTQTIVCYRYCFDEIAFDSKVKRYQDWDLALQAALKYRIGCLNESLVDVYLQSNSITNTIKSEQAKLFVVKKHRCDVDFKNKRMVAQYYKTLADVTRRKSSLMAGKLYFKCFCLKPNAKILLLCLLSLSGIIKLYKPRI